ncbi:MAG: LamG domain-containing protein [Sedimentisphaerales bacterium]|nr:LamG domain-containing protein [Sedimentisphaerales bacterium]
MCHPLGDALRRKLFGLLTLILLFGMIPTSVAQAELVGWWKLDGNANDASGYNHPGTLYGDPQWVGGKLGGALQFDGVDDRVEMPGTSPAEGFPGTEGEVTWTVWFKTPDGGVLNTIMCLGPAGAAHVKGNRSINVEISGVIMIRAHTVGALTSLYSSSTVNDDEWHHVAVPIAFETDGTNDTMKVYIDGDLSKGYETDTVDINAYSADAAEFIMTLGARGTTPFNGLIDDVRIYDHALSDVEILSAMESEPWPYAIGPDPADGALHEATWVTLSWAPGELAVSHDVYLGDTFDGVNEANRESDLFRGNQTSTFYVAGFPGFAYPDGLTPGTTYYWRIDEVNDADLNSPWKGSIWSFSIPPKTAYNPNPADGDAIEDTTATLSWTPGYGAILHTVYFGGDFDTVANATVGMPAGSASYNPGTLEAEKVYYWRVDEFDGVGTYQGDVWAFTTPGAVANPQPANGADDVSMATTLSWAAASNAASHEVYLGLDKETVRGAETTSPEYKGSKTLGAESYDAGLLDANTTYYWRVDAVANGSAVKGPVWTFTVGAYLLVDDFESYTDDDPNNEAIWQTWIDGYGTTDNGAQVGYLLPPYAEQSIVHSGSQSMPLLYANEADIANSEASMTLTTLRDWTTAGVEELSLWVRGSSSNAAEPLYVAIANSAGSPAVVAHDNPSAATSSTWRQWRIALQSFADQGIDLSDVDSLAIGLGRKGGATVGGSGTLYIDDIRLQK